MTSTLENEANHARQNTSTEDSGIELKNGSLAKSDAQDVAESGHSASSTDEMHDPTQGVVFPAFNSLRRRRSHR